MKYLIISDIHGSMYYANIIPSIIEQENVDKVILLGDLYYHGPRNPLPKDYAPMEVCQLLNNFKDMLIVIRGNCDAEVDEMISSFKFQDEVLIELNDKKIYLTHGHHYNIDNLPKNIDIIIYGHFHTGYIKQKNGVICVNAGSITLPKNNTQHSYLILSETEIVLKSIEGTVIDQIKI